MSIVALVFHSTTHCHTRAVSHCSVGQNRKNISSRLHAMALNCDTEHLYDTYSLDVSLNIILSQPFSLNTTATYSCLNTWAQQYKLNWVFCVYLARIHLHISNNWHEVMTNLYFPSCNNEISGKNGNYALTGTHVNSCRGMRASPA